MDDSAEPPPPPESAYSACYRRRRGAKHAIASTAAYLLPWAHISRRQHRFPNWRPPAEKAKNAAVADAREAARPVLLEVAALAELHGSGGKSAAGAAHLNVTLDDVEPIVMSSDDSADDPAGLRSSCNRHWVGPTAKVSRDIGWGISDPDFAGRALCSQEPPILLDVAVHPQLADVSCCNILRRARC
jgi:hypothetical protein